jgi:hypothetical protein
LAFIIQNHKLKYYINVGVQFIEPKIVIVGVRSYDFAPFGFAQGEQDEFVEPDGLDESSPYTNSCKKIIYIPIIWIFTHNLG